MSSGAIVGLVLFCAVGGGLIGVFFYLKGKLRDFSKAAFGTESFIEGYKRQADVLAEQPKSVCGMTRLMEPQIMRDFPDFSWAQFKAKAENLLTSALYAISEGNLSRLAADTSESVKDEIRTRIEENNFSQIKERYENIQIHQTEISNYRHEPGKCIITIQCAVGYLFYKEQNGKVIEGNKERKKQTKYNIELIYVQDADKFEFDNAYGTTCPHCGAPIKGIGKNFVCEYCGLGVTPINIKVWSLHKFYEVDYNHV